MMFELLKTKRQEARKTGNQVHTSVLTTLLGEFERSRNKETPTDEKVFKTLSEFKANVESNLALKPSQALHDELALLDSLISLKPATATEDEITEVIQSELQANAQANMGVLMKALKTKFGMRLDGRLANVVVNKVLQTR